MNVAILGCGPTGLLAAHACRLEGVDFTVFSNKRKSELFGSQYLHKPIPEIVNPYSVVDVKYVVRGTPEQYRQKVHGKWWDGHIAPEDFEPDHHAWNIRQAYDNLWQLYGSDVVNYVIPKSPQHGLSTVGVTTTSVGEIVEKDLKLSRNFDLVISTVPRDLWRIPGEEYIYSEGWVLGDAPEKGVFVNDLVSIHGSNPKPLPDNTIVCDGTDEVEWTRLSKVYGYTTLEWPHHAPKPHPLAAMVRKPLHYTASKSTLNPTSDWLHVGRYGQFEKGVVVTDAWDQVVKKLKEMK